MSKEMLARNIATAYGEHQSWPTGNARRSDCVEKMYGFEIASEASLVVNSMKKKNENTERNRWDPALNYQPCI